MAKTSTRLDRIADMLKRELAILIQRQIKDPRVGPMVSVLEVKVSRDLSHAKAYVSFMLEPEQIPAAVDALNHAASYLRRLLAQTVELRAMPELHFFYDDTLVRANRITNIIEDITKDLPKEE